MPLETFANTPTPSRPGVQWTTVVGALLSGFATITVADGSVFPSAGQFRVLVGDNGIIVTRSGNVLTVVSHEFGEAEHASGSAVYHIVTAGSLANHPRAMTTAGDMEYLSAGLSPTRLGIGSDGQVLTLASGLPSWATSTVAVGNVTGLGVGVATALAATVTGTGGIVLATSPTLVTPSLGIATATSLQVSVGSSGACAIQFGAVNQGFYYLSNTLYWTGGGTPRFRMSGSELKIGSSMALVWGNAVDVGGSNDLVLLREAAHVLAQRNGTNAQAGLTYYTYTDASNYQRMALRTAATKVTLAAETAGTGADNVDVELLPAGSGLVMFGTHAALAAESVTGYISIKTADGTTRKLAVLS